MLYGAEIAVCSEIKKKTHKYSVCGQNLELLNVNTLRTGLLNCLNLRSRGLNFRHRASCI